MNLAYLNPSASVDPALRVPAANLRDRENEIVHHSQKAPSLSSTPSESDWVSPFTLPPLPAFRRARDHHLVLLEGTRQREGSGAYYAAAWGSPYASPSPKAQSAFVRPGRRSIDSELSSPTPINQAPLASLHQRSRRSVDTGDVASPEARRRFLGAPKLHNDLSERSIWLSDSESSGRDDIIDKKERTPRGGHRSGVWGSSPVSAGRSGSHTVNESIDTVTPDTFHYGHTSHPKNQSYMTASHDMELVEEGEPGPALESPTFEPKPLPSLPQMQSQASTQLQEIDDTISPSRPRPSSMHSFQRPKKKVVWKGKTCIIALPVTDRESARLPPVLTAQEVREKIDALNSQGFNTTGFELTDFLEDPSGLASAHSRPPFPDSSDIQSERKMRQFHVCIPNQAEWDQWVQWLQEEKLRALGVTPSTSEPAASATSPFSAPLSRTSSRYAGLVGSPPVGTSSAASNPLRATSNPFSPAFSPASGVGSQVGSGHSSQYNGFPVPAHGYKQSVVIPLSQGHLHSPRDFSPLQANHFSPAIRSPVDGFGRRQPGFSPINPQGMQSLGEVLSPVSNPSSAGPSPNITANVTDFMSLPRDPQQPRSASHEPTHSTLSRPSLPHQSSSLPRTPNLDHTSRPPIEIQHPTPRSHRHNLSAALQKEIDEAEAALESQREDPAEASQGKNAKEPAKPDEATVEELQVELPILKRPETISGADDKSDIETNPSIAASPLLIDDKNPFTNWQALSDAARGDVKKPALIPKLSYKGHKAQPSLSRFNVEAKEFNPSAGFDGSNFAVAGFNPFAAPARPPMSLVRNESNTRQPLGSRLTAEAPAFNPGAASFEPSIPPFKPIESKPKPTFRVPSSTFRVDAPEFDPNKSSPKIPSITDSTSESEPRQTSIFGKVTIDPDSKVSRRTSKALPIVRPRSKDGPHSGSSIENSSFEIEEDEGGRPTAPTDRSKRARRASSDGDQSPIFADSAPFNHNHTRILSEIVDEAPGEKSTVEKVKEKPVDGWAYIAAEPDPVADEISSPPAESSIEMPSVASPFEFRNEDEAIKFSQARPRSFSESEIEPETQEDENIDSEPVSAALSSPLKQSVSSHKSKFSLSALAQPFELEPSKLPQTQKHPQEQSYTPPKPRKVTGLGASRWAATPSPSPSPPPVQSARLSSPPSFPDRLPSPPAHQHPAIKTEYESEPSNVKVSGSLDNSVGSPISVRDEGTRPEDSRSVESHEFALEQPLEHPRPRSDGGDDPVPSFEEIDAVMQHLDRNPELGVEREGSPVRSTPLVDMRLGANFRSDAPSPSPRRRSDQREMRDAASAAAFGLGIGIHRLSAGKEEVSDWNDALSSTEEDKVQSRAQFFDGHVNDLVDGVLENRLGPLQRTLQTIQHSIALMATRPTSKGERRGLSTDAKESDADDEDDYDAFEGFSSYRSRSPEANRDNRRNSRIRAAVAEGMAAYKDSVVPQKSEVDLSSLLSEIAELRQQLQKMQEAPQQDQQKDMRAALDEVISNHPRLRGSRVQQDHEASESKYKIHVDGLNAMLNARTEQAEHETKLRKLADEEIEVLKRALAEAEADAAEYKEASDAAQQSLEAFVKEKEAYRSLEQELELINRKNEELEMNLDEYRKYKVELQDDIDEERDKNDELKRILRDVKERFDERSETCKILRTKVEKVQDQMALAVRELGSEQAQWRTRESELLTKMSIVENALDQAARQREKVEVDYHDIVRQYREAVLYKDRFENLQMELSKSHEMIALLQNESRRHQDNSFRLQKEFDHVTANKDADVVTATARLTAELESAKSQLESYRTDSEARIVRLQSRLDSAELDLEEQKAKHDTLTAEAAEVHTRAIQEVNEKHKIALESQQAAHQSHLTDLRERHTRAMHNSSDDRHRLEHQFNEKLSLSEDKVRHLEGKLVDLEERLEITKSAARAAVEAATAKGMNLPTPASSVVASPPQRAASASLSLVKGTELPEKIPVQSLRESIMVLQEQLQNREQKIEKLEAELAAVDKQLPTKLKERETEVSWLRELLAVRVDDIEDMITTLSSPTFDREHVKDAAIRLKANIQMEQQIKERAAQSSGLTSTLPVQLPSMSSLAAYAQSPRQALPLAAAAAWGNFRKVRDMGGEKITEYLSQGTMATPSKSSIPGSPGSLLSGIMTPPNTEMRTPNVERDMPAPAMRPLAAAAAARKAQSGTAGAFGGDAQPKPLRGYSSKPRALGARREMVVEHEAHLGASVRSPTSPTPSPQTPDMKMVRAWGEGADMVGQGEDDFSGDVDEDASPLGGRG